MVEGSEPAHPPGERKHEARLRSILETIPDAMTASRAAAMGALATAIAHELNQPLTAIANYVGTARGMLDKPDEETLGEVRAMLDDCAVQSVRAGEIVRRLRDFIARGETEPRIESLARVINEACALALIGAGGGGVGLEIMLDGNADSVLIDCIQLRQVVLNLVCNAIEAMAAAPVRRLRIGSKGIGGRQIRVTIEDSGPGLPAEVAERLFEPFLGTKPDGMGLGLSICRSIVQRHGGRIWADHSSLGGTAFHFTLIDGRAD